MPRRTPPNYPCDLRVLRRVVVLGCGSRFSAMVWMMGGSPSLVRSRLMVTLTVLVKRVGGFIPDALEEFFGGNNAALGGEEEFEDAEFFGSRG